MRRNASIGVVLLAMVATPCRADWRDDHRRGLKALEAGRLDRARRLLERAAAENPEPSALVRGSGMKATPYLPYLQLSRVAYRQRDLDEAERWFARALEAGVAAETEEGRALLREQELLLENLRFLSSAGRAGGAPARTDRDREREGLLAKRVASRCGEPPPGRGRDMPWYYHHGLAKELAEHGDWTGSLQQLALAIERRSEPDEFARTYGMGFVRYRPWYEMGRVHYRLGNWACAADALALSEDVERIEETDPDAARRREELLAGARRRAGAGEE